MIVITLGLLRFWSFIISYFRISKNIIQTLNSYRHWKLPWCNDICTFIHWRFWKLTSSSYAYLRDISVFGLCFQSSKISFYLCIISKYSILLFGCPYRIERIEQRRVRDLFKFSHILLELTIIKATFCDNLNEDNASPPAPSKEIDNVGIDFQNMVITNFSLKNVLINI